ncbi:MULTISPECIES: hypothetical protein [unclassified Solwaraspora]|uniref:hypothetical protein n=1 Tax=unclassified Solwaraspora TaxID=2627926 RepID=UPI00259B9F78|nr:hypothetical protein [Solwaraspora sp. WMMA2056]WJK39777.1 hypothetical protein O7608_25525 [Solwaraspora sp. WMMA2056]
MTGGPAQQPGGGVRWFVEGWQPGYGTSFEAPEAGAPGATDDSSDATDLAVELDPAAWQALRQPADVRAPDVVLLVDGVRRIDASLWSDEPDGVSYPAIAASYAAGVVRCDLRAGSATLAGARPERGLFTPSAAATDLTVGQIRYPARRVDHPDPATLPQVVQPALAALEIAVSEQARAGADGADDELLVVDGPLRGRQLPNTIGYIKSVSKTYLPAGLLPVVTGLRPAERSPVFLHGTRWRTYSWYLRLPGPRGAPWAGIVRVECRPDITAQAAIALADLSLAALPRFASTPYKDPRAPQNLVPIAGLERRLRAMLGDARLLHRALSLSAARR